MFRTPWYDRASIRSDEGFSVRWGSDRAVYEHLGRKLTFNVDIGAGEAHIFVDSISRWDDDPTNLIDSTARLQIAGNVKKAFEWKGLITILKP